MEHSDFRELAMKNLTVRQLVWPAFLVAALLLLGIGNGTA